MTLAMPDPRELDDFELTQMVRRISAQDKYDWKSKRRENQTPPKSFTNWVIVAGRGFGKTRTGAETLREYVEHRPLHVAVIHRKATDVREICFEHRKSGLLNVIPPELQKSYTKSPMPRLTLTNGTIFRGFAAEVPDSIRGFEFDMAWMDEYASWNRHTAQDMFDQTWFCLRESPTPRVIITTTPKRLTHVVELAKRAGMLKDTTPQKGYVVTRGHTMDNKANLSEAAMDELMAVYDGTRLGRQELGGELLEDVENALWSLELIEAVQWTGPMPEMALTVTAVDPSGSEDGDATGIVTVGRTKDGVVYVLADDTTNGSPEYRYEQACLAAHRHGSAVIYYEGAYGGDNVAMALRSAWEHLLADGRVEGMMPKLVKTVEQGSKAARAEPVVGLYEQHAKIAEDGTHLTERIWHAKRLAKLEDEMTTWEVDSTWSPNRIDACVYGVRYLTVRIGRDDRGSVGYGLAGESMLPGRR